MCEMIRPESKETIVPSGLVAVKTATQDIINYIDEECSSHLDAICNLQNHLMKSQ